MARSQLSRRHVFDLNLFETADQESFAILFEFLRARGSYVARGRTGLAKVMPSSFKALWSPEYREIPNLAPRRSVYGRVVVHHAMHSLMGDQYGAELKSKPQLTLLTESLAGALELYFEFRHIAAGGDILDLFDIRFFESSARKLNRRDHIRTLNEMIESPFEAFKTLTLLSFEVSNALFQIALMDDRQSLKVQRQLSHKLLRNPHFVFLLHKDFSNFALYVMTYCGKKSSTEDKKQVRKCIEKMKTCRSMPEFLNKLAEPL